MSPAEKELRRDLEGTSRTLATTLKAASAMLAALKAAAEAHGPLGDDTRPAWWPTACAATAQAEAAGIKVSA